MAIKTFHITHSEITTDNRIVKECKSLSNIGYQVYGIGLTKNINGEKYTSDNLNLESIYNDNTSIKINLLRHLYSFIKLLRGSLHKQKSINAQILHCHDLVGVVIGFTIKLLNPNLILIYDAHELESERNLQSILMSKIYFRLEKSIVPFVDHQIVVSHKIKEWYAKNVGFKKISVILNTPDILDIQKKNEYLRRAYNIPDSKFIYIYSGVLNEGRGIRKILEISQELEDHFVFIGYGPLEQLIKEKEENSSNVHFHGKVNSDELLKILASADIGLCLLEKGSLSMYYALPNKLFEYLFSGLRVVASDFPEIKKTLTETKYGVTCDIDNNLDIIKKLKEVHFIEKPNYSEKLRSYSWSSQEIELGIIYSQLNKN